MLGPTLSLQREQEACIEICMLGSWLDTYLGVGEFKLGLCIVTDYHLLQIFEVTGAYRYYSPTGS